MDTRASAIVGRSTEIFSLERCLFDTEITSHRSAFLIGETGIGKSRLVREITTRALAAGVRTVFGRGGTVRLATPLRPITQALLALARDETLPIDRLGPYRAVLGQLVPEWRAPEHADVAASPVLLAEAVLRLLGLLRAPGGALLVLEDLHNTDAETLAVVEHLVDNLPGRRVALLCTMRPEPGSALELVEHLIRMGEAVRLDLTGLAGPAIAGIAASCLGCDATEISTALAEQLAQHSDGNPFLIEELLRSYLDDGTLVRGPAGWSLAGPVRQVVPASMVRSIAIRTERVGHDGQGLLRVAAVMRDRFPMRLVGRVAGVPDDRLAALAREAIVAQLITPDEDNPDWYVFANTMIARALRAQLTPGEHTLLAGRLADAVLELYPDLPDEWCQRSAGLRVTAGQPELASELYAIAGRRAMAGGAHGSAVALLDRAYGLLPPVKDTAPETVGDVLGSLLAALGESGEFERAFGYTDAIAELGEAGLSGPRQAALHLALAGVARLAGRWSEGLTQVGVARRLLGPDATDEQRAPVDAIAAHLTLGAPGVDRLHTAEYLAHRAIDAAALVPLPSVLCEAWHVLGMIYAGRDLAEANACLTRVVRTAERYHLPSAGITAAVRIASHDWLADGDTGPLRRSMADARRTGAVITASTAGATLALDAVLRADFSRADAMIGQVRQDVSRLPMAGVQAHVRVVTAISAAHQGRRALMEVALADTQEWIDPNLRQLSAGLARAVCALLEEDRSRARHELTALLAAESANPTACHLAGQHGLALLLGVLAGDQGWPEYERIAGSLPGRLRWNRQFVRLANATLLGADGQVAAAQQAAAEAADAARPYPTAAHLGRRLVAEHAHEQGWGEPVRWLRQAEDHFYQAGVPAVVDACRRLQRRLRVPVRQRRRGLAGMPQELKESGVTAREYEVLQLVVAHCTNKAIGARLRISPRTVEKHVANLLIKTGTSDRTALSDHLPPG